MDIGLKENIYSHLHRLEWILSYLKGDDVIMEFGCGTGYMITRPLVKMGYDAYGIDTDRESIDYGKELMRIEGLEPDRLKSTHVADFALVPDVIIASEVLEHIPSLNLDKVMGSLHAKLKPGALILVTVPNGFGWFELESFLWNKLLLGRLCEVLKIPEVIGLLKRVIAGRYIDAAYPSTLSSSPHVQRFTLQGIRKKLEEHRFEIIEEQGAGLLSGPFSHLLFSGINPVMNLNMWLGCKLPKVASAFYIAARKL